MIAAELKDEKIKLTADLERARESHQYAYGMWLETRLSSWDEEVMFYSRKIGRLNARLDEISEIEFPSEVLAAE
ncbi:hypothetical protein [uncultured Ruegeria sp.]|uniref:hypothetical protein n=1 Tax=uncultured Ruegeria sp. TaxID=259304 RepID=UPI002624D975|nr:hypothetical protein [uncultured Ruegeria sp.]